MINLSNKPAENVDLSSVTKAQLLEYATANGIDGVDSSMKKAEIYAKVVEQCDI